jgi:hypothetical protein
MQETKVRPSSRASRVEAVALLDVARLQAAPEPALPLRRSAVGEGIGNDIALRLLLQAVIADGSRGVQSLFDISGFKVAFFCADCAQTPA